MGTSSPSLLTSLPGQQTPIEELWNAITHGIGAILSIAALVVMVVYASMGGDPWRIVAVSIYGASMVLLFTSSTLYHAFTNLRWKHVFWILDHAFIYLLIAGTYTPFTLVTIRGGWGWSIFGLVWGLALFGIAYKLLYIGRFPMFSTILYLVMGWAAVVALYPLVMALPVGGLALMVLGGLLYSGGVAFYSWHSLRFSHVWWHLFVLGGAASHFFAVLWYVVPLMD